MHGRYLTQSETEFSNPLELTRIPVLFNHPQTLFSNALLISVSLVGLLIPDAVAVPAANVTVAVAQLDPVVSIPILSSVLGAPYVFASQLPADALKLGVIPLIDQVKALQAATNPIGVANPIGLLASASVNIIIGIFVGSATNTLSGLVGQIIAGGGNLQGLGGGDPLTKALASVELARPNANGGALARAVAGLLALAGPLVLGGSSPASVNALITILAAIAAAVTNLKTLIGSCPTCATDPQFLGQVSGLLGGLALPSLA
ncbi:hypothetical protein DFH08DRAFT_978868 [Mycena albidolilacea]|uniref:Uncharacterized protein n=1 Tax=Mycena albidolilacea TaxID=1033008 RepID=A0AAD6YXR3_9AGAR|nr:hypothetical protein DFH08DRAFT_978868 [Mycena albidolilacea]